MIERHPIRIDISKKFFQLSQNPFITDQWLTAKNPTARARHWSATAILPIPDFTLQGKYSQEAGCAV
jgi:hypothetical protein